MNTNQPFGQGYRLRFIEKMLAHYGTLNRETLTDYFGLSLPQVSLDIRAYTELAPDNLVYDKSAKLYRRGAQFTKVFE